MSEPTATAPESSTSPLSPVAQRLTELGVTNDTIERIVRDLGVASLADLTKMTEADLVSVGMKPIPARNLVAALKSGASAESSSQMTSSSMLPPPTDDESLLEALKTGGVAKVGETEVIAAVRVLLIERLGLEGIERRVADAIETRALRLGEPAPTIFYELEASMGRRNYAEILRFMGMPGNLVSAARRKELLRRISSILGLFQAFQNRLTAWQESWMARMSNPSAMLAGITAMMGGGMNPASALITDAPDTGVIVDAVSSLFDQLNSMFAGTGIPVARALAADAIATRQFLENPALVGAVGAGSREEMLKNLGIAVSADLVRAERDLSQFIVGVLRLPKVATAQLPAYIVALAQVGAQLPWSQLTGSNAGSNGKASWAPQDPVQARSGHQAY